MGVTRGTLTLRREDGRVVCESVGVSDSTFRRVRGLLGRRRLPPDEGIVLRPAWSIHTAFMRFPIDVVFLDHDQLVLRIAHSLKPFRTASCRGAREIVELSAGECERRGLEVGDRITWAPRAIPDDEASSENAMATASRHGAVVIATVDQRFAKLARFLLDARGIEVIATVPPDGLLEALEDRPDAVVLDAGDQLAAALKLANAARARRPVATVVIVGEGAAERAPSGLRIFHKWDETDDAMATVEQALGEPHAEATPLHRADAGEA